MTGVSASRRAWCRALAMMVAVAPAIRSPASDRFEDLPGAGQVASLRRAFRGGPRVTDLTWMPEALVYRRGGDWNRVPRAGGEPVGCDAPTVERHAEPPGPVDPPAMRARQRTRVTSPDGAWRAEHRGGGVRLVEVATGASSPVREPEADAPGVVYGTADWVYGEELDQNDAMWWSPDGRFLAFYAFDVSRVPSYELPRGWSELRTRPFAQRYPKAGDPNAIVGLMVLDRSTGRVATVDVGDDPEQYVYAVSFAPGDAGLLFHRTNRRQDRLQLCLADPVSGRTRVIVEETQPTFQENRPLFRFLADGDRFLWGSERTGFRNLELRRLSDASSVIAVTRHGFPVGEVIRVDEEGGQVWYTAFSAELPMLSQLHRTGLDGRGDVRLTPADRGWSRFDVSPEGDRFVATGQTPERPPLVQLFAADGSATAVATLDEADLAAFRDRRMPPPELFRCTAADGVTPIYGVLHFPPGFDPSRQYPLLVDVYGGPHSQAVTGRFDPGPAERGFGLLVARVDNRGTQGRGKAFESATYLRLGGPDADDQAAAVRFLRERPYVDGSRVAIAGHSYGGTMAATCVLRHPEVFRAGVAGAPVTDWRNYDTIYTERWMRTPAENPEGYDAACLPCDAGELRGDLLMLHGMQDDNVHPSNTLQMAKALQEADVPFEMQLFPDSDHSIGSPAYRSAKWSFLLDRLGVTAPDLIEAVDPATGGEEER